MTRWDSDLPFSMQQQQQTEWCWAATSSSVSVYYDPSNSPWTQCKVVNAEQSQNTCCQNGGSSPCNQPWYLDKSLTRTRNYDHYTTGNLSINDLDTELAKGRPVGTRIGWSGGGGHFMVLAGASVSEKRVHVHDPIYGDQDYDYDAYCNSYQGSGTWTHTYYTVSFLNPAPTGGLVLPVPFRLISALEGTRLLPIRTEHDFNRVQGKFGEVNLTHPVFTEGLDALAAGRGLSGAQESGSRTIVIPESGDVYAEDIEPALKTPKSVSRGPLVAQTFQIMSQAHRQMMSEKAPRQARFLQIPGIYVFAVWLKANDDKNDLLIPMKPAPAPLRAGDTYRRAEFESIVTTLAEKRLQFDERPEKESP